MCHRVSCFLWEPLQKAALGDDFGLLVADDYKKWNLSAFLRAKVKPGGFTAEAALKDECLAGNRRVWTGHGYRHANACLWAPYCTNSTCIHAVAKFRVQSVQELCSLLMLYCWAALRHCVPQILGGSSFVRLWEGDSWLAESSEEWEGRGGVGLCGGGWWWSDSQQPLLGSQGKRRARR